AVELGGPEPDQLAEPRVDAGVVKLLGGGLVQVRHRASEAVGQRVEVEADRDGHVAVRVLVDCHGSYATWHKRSIVMSNSVAKTWANGLDLHLDLSGTRVRARLENALRDAVRSGRLGAGMRLPPSRTLAGDLGIARNTVAEVYSQLVAEGWLTARAGSGTSVASHRAVAAASAEEV